MSWARTRPGPRTALTGLRNALFYTHIALATLVYGLIGLIPLALRGREGAIWVSTVWLDHLVLAARLWLGLTYEVRGTPPAHDCIIAAKHQSFWDILAIAHAVPRRAFIMKREVMRVPVMGWYAWKVGCIPIDRSRGRDAMAAIGARVDERLQAGTLGQLIIYPEGTRTLPGEVRPYKHGVGTIRGATGLDVVPVATNAGLFWPRHGWGIVPGRAVIEFLPAIGPAVADADFMPLLAARIEGASQALMAEAGFLDVRVRAAAGAAPAAALPPSPRDI